MRDRNESVASRAIQDAADLDIDATTITALRERLPAVADDVVAAIMAEVPSYAGALTGRRGANIRHAVQTTLDNFLELAGGTASQVADLGAGADAAFALGRGEAANGRSMEALLAAYRVGARVAWRGWSAVAVDLGLHADTMAKFAELVFAFIDELSATSAAGHADALAMQDRARQRQLERLGRSLLDGATDDVLLADAERADWTPPTMLVAVLVAEARAHAVRQPLDPATLLLAENLPSAPTTESMTVLLVPADQDTTRAHLLQLLRGMHAVVGPARPWRDVKASFARAVRAVEVVPATGEPIDTERCLVELVLNADSDAYDDLRERALAPLRELPPTTVARLTDTLRSWLLHQGRRDAVAEDLFVHPQTVRYRMGQLREHYGEALSDPRQVLELTVALALRR
ncbi:PucR family transcriptional regulator [Haloechinothrix halophila]|uniref:PucR family transcriptional regulator n=1 Tax=Haloechinothrix halophila TaxID=1069073 RepID=UPI0004123CCE|nr:PucR family transcriptional regulator [Haloechinothrix halophila]